MKQSEHKENLEKYRLVAEELMKAPKIIKVLKCKNKVFSKSGCHCCWHCEKCGRTGCDNLLSFAPWNGDKLEQVECGLTEG